MPMTAVLAVLVVVLFGAVVLLALRQQPVPQPVAPVAPQQIDVQALVAAVSTQVEATMRKTASENLEATSKQSAAFFDVQSKTLDQQTTALLQPFAQQIDELGKKVAELHNEYVGEKSAVDGLLNQIGRLQQTTTTLASALKSPTSLGSWGENQLRNVIELAGMEPFCDYSAQFTGGEGETSQRPDVVINLPNGAHLAVDAKAPKFDYEAMGPDATSDVRQAEVKKYASAIRSHVDKLAAKKYWDQFPTSPDFVVMFIPTEGFVADAMRADPGLMEYGMRKKVLVASPMNLLALLLAVAKGWQAHKVAEHAEQVAKLGSEVYDRVGVVLEHVGKMGKAISTTNSSFNDMVGSIEGRLLVTLRKFRELGVVQTDVAEIEPVELMPRELSAPELPRELNE